MVAMLGASMPQPLAIPPTVKPSPRTTASLGRVSVVRMPLAASTWPWRLSLLGQLGGGVEQLAASAGGMPIRPVEQTSISPGLQPTPSAAAAHIASASARPFAPVPALALPELTTTPAAIPPDACSRSRLASTGGARNLFWVNTAAAGTGLPSSVASMAKSRRLRLTPAWQPAATNPSAAVTLKDRLPCWTGPRPRRGRASGWRTGSSARPRPCRDCRSRRARRPCRCARRSGR